LPAPSIRTSPGIADDSIDVRVDGVTALTGAFADAPEIVRVPTDVIAVIDPPSGSFNVSSMSYSWPASRSNRLPACRLPHCPLPEPNVPVVFDPAGTRTSGIPIFHDVAPLGR